MPEPEFAPRPRTALLVLSGLLALPGVAATALVLLPPVSWSAWQYALLALEFSLFLTLPAVLGLVLALYAYRFRRRASLALAGLNAVLLTTSLVPAASLWSAARAEGATLSLTEYTAGTATSADREPLTVEYAEADGVPLVLDVWEPAEPSDEPLPVVVNIHGGADDLPQSLLPRWDTWLADGGDPATGPSGGGDADPQRRVVFDVDYRYFPEDDWAAPVRDVRCALGWVRENAAGHGGDPERIAVSGQSAGALLALLATYGDDHRPSCDTEVPEVDAVIAWYAGTDVTADAAAFPRRLLASPVNDELVELEERMMGGSVEEVPEEYAAMSPIRLVGPDTPPTLLLTAGHDLFLSPEDNRRMAAELAEQGVPYRHVELPWAEHMYDLNWGGLASQITRHSVDAFLREHH
ncbi:alpha/beta hydrolase [Nocardiopsis ganjiahuensis]|uniref:alpha/beta hydrolase n=1 Tax=Nocardiopsis ganjiahuensis TaxID=239984 RepID=UPI00034B7D70|nr:alpha/beta hydrolase [Nocardiopsis ganjiahuensis]